MKKKLFAIGISCALLLSGCGTPAPAHTHTALNTWEADLVNHQKVCECGEAFDAGAHTLEENICTVCGSEVAIFEDNSGFVYTFTEYGDTFVYLNYDNAGNAEYKEVYEYTYDEQGNKTKLERKG